MNVDTYVQDFNRMSQGMDLDGYRWTTGDVANLSSSKQCQDCDPMGNRPVLFPGELDELYEELKTDKVNRWFEGFGDLPKA